MESHHHVSSSAATASSAAVKLHSQHARDKGIACSLFAETGECSVSKCPYAHITSTTRRPIPQSVCTYYMRYRCLRDDCPFFHLSQERLDELIASGAQDYCPLDGVPRRNPLIPLSAENPPLPAAEVTGARAPDMNRATAETAQRIATASAAQAATPSNHVRRTPNIVQRQASFPHPSTNTIPGHVTVSVGNNYAAATTGNSASPALITPHSSFRTEGGSFAMTSTPMHPMQYVASTQVPSTPLMTHEVVLLPDPRGPHSPLTSHQAQHLGHSHTPATFGYPTPIMSPAASFHQFSTLTNAPSFAVLPAQQVSFEGSQHQHQQQPTPLVYYNSSSLPPPTPITPSSSFYGAPFAGIPYVHMSAHPPANRAPYQ